MELLAKSKVLQLITVFFLLAVLTIAMMSASFLNFKAQASIKNPQEQPKKNNGRGIPLPVKTLPPEKSHENEKKNPSPACPATVESSQKVVYLTFDDGPEKFSGDLISLLDHYHAKATFFMLDGNIRKYPDAVRRMVRDGDSVGLHGVTHDRKKFYASVDSVLGEMNQDRKTLKEVTGVDSFLIRTPYGSAPDMKPAYKQAVYQNKYLMWDWNIDSMDWFYRDHRYVDNVIAQIEKRKKQKGPLVVLMHEKRETLALLPQLLNYLSSQHYECKGLNSSMVPVHFK